VTAGHVLDFQLGLSAGAPAEYGRKQVTGPISAGIIEFMPDAFTADNHGNMPKQPVLTRGMSFTVATSCQAAGSANVTVPHGRVFVEYIQLQDD
jgi:hypothetical protein